MAMAKLKVTDLKKYLNTLDEPQLRDEILRLYSQLPQVQEFYAQAFMSENDRKAMLERYKNKIYAEFWTRGGQPRNPSNAQVKKLISDFENVAATPYDVVELLLHHVEVATDYAASVGGMSDSEYNASSNAFSKALGLIVKNQYQEYFGERCKSLVRTDNLDYWYIDELQEIMTRHGM